MPLSAGFSTDQRYSWSDAVTSGLGKPLNTGGRKSVETVKSNRRSFVESTSSLPVREWTRIKRRRNGSPA